jgi:hypothetical protein
MPGSGTALLLEAVLPVLRLSVLRLNVHLGHLMPMKSSEVNSPTTLPACRNEKSVFAPGT